MSDYLRIGDWVLFKHPDITERERWVPAVLTGIEKVAYVYVVSTGVTEEERDPITEVHWDEVCEDNKSEFLVYVMSTAPDAVRHRARWGYGDSIHPYTGVIPDDRQMELFPDIPILYPIL